MSCLISISSTCRRPPRQVPRTCSAAGSSPRHGRGAGARPGGFLRWAPWSPLRAGGKGWWRTKIKRGPTSTSRTHPCHPEAGRVGAKQPTDRAGGCKPLFCPCLSPGRRDDPLSASAGSSLLHFGSSPPASAFLHAGPAVSNRLLFISVWHRN